MASAREQSWTEAPEATVRKEWGPGARAYVLLVCARLRGGTCVVLQVRDNGRTGLFGGGRAQGDSGPEATATRELHEETGLSVRPQDLHVLNAGFHWTPWADAACTEAPVVVFLARTDLSCAALLRMMADCAEWMTESVGMVFAPLDEAWLGLRRCHLKLMPNLMAGRWEVPHRRWVTTFLQRGRALLAGDAVKGGQDSVGAEEKAEEGASVGKADDA